MISKLTFFIYSSVGWSGPNRVASTTLIRAMTRVEDRETPSGSVSMSASYRECAAVPSAMP